MMRIFLFGSSLPPVVWGSFLAIVYLAIVAKLRYRRSRWLIEKYGMRSRQDFHRMTTDDAQAILQELVEMEFPKLMGLSIVFALFKTYGVPSVSSLLVSTGQLASLETASKRTADTGVMLLEFALNKPTSERTIKSIARMNFLHSRYQASGKIKDADMLYTLSLFACEPNRWIERFEWRDLTDMERCAGGTYWKAMGDAMHIAYTALPSAKTGWTDGLHWLDEIRAWSENYEAANMKPADTNKQLAEAHLDLLLFNLPPRLNTIAKTFVAVLIGPRLQEAMMLPRPTPIYHMIVQVTFGMRKWMLRNVFLPRPEFMRKQYIPTAPDEKSGRYNSVEYLSHPWYVKPSFKNRWAPKAWVTRLLGRKLPGDDGNKYAPEGYIFEELGPSNLVGKGLDEMAKTERALKEENRGGCPFR
jgi:hypothetical protein